jgi:hypothetical protein
MATVNSLPTKGVIEKKHCPNKGKKGGGGILAHHYHASQEAEQSTHHFNDDLCHVVSGLDKTVELLVSELLP